MRHALRPIRTITSSILSRLPPGRRLRPRRHRQTSCSRATCVTFVPSTGGNALQRRLPPSAAQQHDRLHVDVDLAHDRANTGRSTFTGAGSTPMTLNGTTPSGFYTMSDGSIWVTDSVNDDCSASPGQRHCREHRQPLRLHDVREQRDVRRHARFGRAGISSSSPVTMWRLCAAYRHLRHRCAR